MADIFYSNMSNTERIHGFDALRTIAMWLGIVLHAIIAYKAVPEANWPHDAMYSRVLEWLYGYIHQFRMPLFFMVAGFFARMVLRRSGLKYFAQQRFKRIFVPFACGLLLIVPITIVPFTFFKFSYADHLPYAIAWQKSIAGLFHWNGLVHLWFLYYLLIFYVATIAVWPLFKGRTLSMPARLQPVIAVLQIPIAIALLFLLLLAFHQQLPPVYTGIKPDVFLFAYNGFFYLGGWLLHRHIASVRQFSQYGYLFLIAATALSIQQFVAAGSLHPWLQYLFSAAQTVLLVAGFTGLFIRYFHAENKWWRYCADASYWVYLVHLFIAASLQVLLLQTALPVVLRLPVVLLCTFVLSLGSYQLFVRYTIIGKYLHGKRNRPVNQHAIEKRGMFYKLASPETASQSIPQGKEHGKL